MTSEIGYYAAPHNLVLEILLQFGIVGGVSIIATLMALVFSPNKDKGTRSLILPQLIALGVFGMTLAVMTNIMFWLTISYILFLVFSRKPIELSHQLNNAPA